MILKHVFLCELLCSNVIYIACSSVINFEINVQVINFEINVQDINFEINVQDCNYIEIYCVVVSLKFQGNCLYAINLNLYYFPLPFACPAISDVNFRYNF